MVNLSVVEQLLNHISRYSLCKTTDKILLAVSGGLDSMVMLHSMKAAGFSVAVVHCNFQLRGEASGSDEDLVKATCLQQNIPFYARKFATAEYAAAQRISVQMAARDLRYEYFREILDEHRYDHVATAHHFNDVIESVLMNLVRGTGIDGLTGIAPKKQKVIRPLLFATRAMLLHYAIENRITWREDASNLKDEYQRNFMRHQVVPRLQELNPNFEETFRDTHERLTGANQFSRAYIKSFESTAVEAVDGRLTIDMRKMRELESPAVMLWELVKDLGFKFDQCRKVVSDHQAGRIFLSASHQIVVDREHYIVEKKRSADFMTVAIEQGQRECGVAPNLMSLREVPRVGFRLSKDPAVAQLDLDRLRFPLLWRSWRAGDYFVPLGMSQEKKLSDFLIDLKIPFNSKADITVLESGGEIIWVVGYRISDRYKVTADTARVLVIERHATGR
ncbi:MAG TPA: tRNA lysidine(34) synthetase TilS [Chryseosolibacter sp.]